MKSRAASSRVTSIFLRREALFEFFEFEIDDLSERRLVERFEDHEAIESVEEFRLEVFFHRGFDLFLHGLVVHEALFGAKAHFGRLADQIGAEVRGHDDDRIAEIDLAADRIGEASFFEDLQQEIHHIGVRFFHFVEENDAIGAPAHLLGELSAFFIADIARRRSGHAADGEFFHVFRHVDLDQRVFAAEQVRCEQAGQVGFAHAGRAEEQEGADRAVGIFDIGSAAANRAGRQC